MNEVNTPVNLYHTPTVYIVTCARGAASSRCNLHIQTA